MTDTKLGMFRGSKGENFIFPFIMVSSLFLLWGFCNGMIDVMDKHFQQELHLTLAESAWVQFAHYLGYFLMALPAGWLASRLGYKGGIIAGLLLVALGGFWFIPATHISAFWAFLVGVGVIAAGLTFLETVANPYTTVLGPSRYGAARINLAQSANGIGWVFGPIVGGMFFYGTDVAGASTGSQTLWIPYASVAAFVLVLAVVFYFIKLPDLVGTVEHQVSQTSLSESSTLSLWKQPHFLGAVAAQFFYVAAQAGIFSFFINYMTSQTPSLPESFHSGFLTSWFSADATGSFLLSDKGAASLASFGFLFFLFGRFSGAVILRSFSANKVLALYALINVLLCGVVFLKLGWLSVAAVFLSYFFMSIMFPTIFALGIFGLGSKAKQASAFIVMAIMGGAILPKLMGHVGDVYGMSKAFIVPLGCFLVIALYAYLWPKLSGTRAVTAQI